MIMKEKKIKRRQDKKVLLVYFGSYVAIFVTVLLLNYANVFNDVFFEPFPPCWFWIAVFFVVNTVQLSLLLLLWLFLKNKIPLFFIYSPLKLFFFGFLFSTIYVLCDVLLLQRISFLNNNYFIVLIFFPILIWYSLIFLFGSSVNKVPGTRK